MTLARCPLCGGESLRPILCKERLYHRCERCELIHLEPSQRLSEADEKAVYDDHENEIDDPGYRRFLSRTFDEVLKRKPAPARGLDFGCGPGPALVAMAQEAGYRMAQYDKYFHPDEAALTGQYDFITSTEVVEHLSEPLPILDRLWSLLAPGGLLVLQTKRVLDDERFRSWHYRNDPTHITFFAEASFNWLGERWSSNPKYPHADVVCFQKNA
ncbi:class I SAM-dependent methyltransferase [Marinobacterium sediminicola]|uniref:Methyltransferase domain-containing protein n=1 Tax=Marinobacterium sediminicola TaxID=518898 RepID=A0ABY1RYL6_9GAMM|nr:class I SAM-dependent methyltransferase [Marinobacterium sediminicola]ULG68094.1 class I SAM-dependent methyltransferase [Marinobacterium sediminicola]SMR73394.1 Methyltransferase domain-containing protein [Marinobacterium sediminicola]